PRHLEHTQMVHLMKMYAEEVLANRWDPEEASSSSNPPATWRAGFRKTPRRSPDEPRGDPSRYPLVHRSNIRNFYAYTGDFIDEEKLLQLQHSHALWTRARNFLINLRGLPCWIDRNLSGRIFGAKQNRDYWLAIFKTGSTPNGIKVLTEPLDIQKMIKS